MRKIWLLPLLLIVAFSFSLRVYRLADVPNGFYIDEASFGYNAYSIAETGRDEYGVKWPLYTRSFYSGKNPAYLYATVLSVKAFGLTPFAVRFPAAVFGALAVLFIGLLAREMYGGVAGVAAALVAVVSPWGFMFSRVAMEPASLLCAVALAAWLMMLSLRKPGVAPAAGLAVGATFYCYAPAFAFMPLLVLLFVVLYRKQMAANWKRWLAGGVIAALLLLPHLLPGVKGEEQLLHFRRSLITSPDARNLNDSLIDSMNLPWKEQIKESPFARTAVIFSRNYLTSYGYKFLFIEGDTSTLRQSVPCVGVLLRGTLALVLYGLFVAVMRRSRADLLLLGWLLLYPLGPSIAAQWVPSAIREIHGLVAFAVFAALGVASLIGLPYKDLKSSPGRYGIFLLLIVLGSMFALNSARFMKDYFVDYPVYAARAWYYGYGEAVSAAQEMSGDYDVVIMSQEVPFGYIYPLFYLKYDPAKYQEEAPETRGFNYQGMAGPFLVGPPLPCKEEFRCLYISNVQHPGFMRTIRTIPYPDGTPAVFLMESPK